MEINSKTYETHFELAERIGKDPVIVADRLLRGDFPNYGASGGVFYLPLKDGPNSMDFFEKIMAARYGLG